MAFEKAGLHVHTDLGCKIIIYLVHVFGSFAAFEIVLMTLDKVIAIKKPHKSVLLCTTKRANMCSVINLFTMVVFYLPNLDFSKSVGKGNCARYVKKGWYITVYSYISLIITPVIPVTMLFVMNIIIIKAVWKSQQMRNQNQTGKQDTNTEM